MNVIFQNIYMYTITCIYEISEPKENIWANNWKSTMLRTVKNKTCQIIMRYTGHLCLSNSCSTSL